MRKNAPSSITTESISGVGESFPSTMEASIIDFEDGGNLFVDQSDIGGDERTTANCGFSSEDTHIIPFSNG